MAASGVTPVFYQLDAFGYVIHCARVQLIFNSQRCKLICQVTSHSASARLHMRLHTILEIFASTVPAPVPLLFCMVE